MVNVRPIFDYLGVLGQNPGVLGEDYTETLLLTERQFQQCIMEQAAEGNSNIMPMVVYLLKDVDKKCTSIGVLNPIHTSITNSIKFVNLAYEANATMDICSQIKSTEADEVENEATTIPIIKGIQGLATYLGIGKTKAQQIVNSGLLKKAGIQYWGGGQCFKKNLLDKYVAENPTAFRGLKYLSSEN